MSEEIEREADYEEHMAELEATNPAFREAWERARPRHAFRRALIGARIAAGLTQKELAERLGVKQPAIARLERGERLPTVETLYRLARALGVDFIISEEKPLAVRPHRAA